MKKIAAIVVLAFITLTALANEYTDKLTVTVNGESVEQQTTIDVTKGEDGKYTLSLNSRSSWLSASGTARPPGIPRRRW